MIAPDRFLHTLPFEALEIGPANQRPKYLIDVTATNYVLTVGSRVPLSPAENEITFVAAVEQDRYALPGTEHEIASLQATLE